jgi:hypothetical protein
MARPRKLVSYPQTFLYSSIIIPPVLGHKRLRIVPVRKTPIRVGVLVRIFFFRYHILQRNLTPISKMYYFGVVIALIPQFKKTGGKWEERNECG